MLGGLQGLAGTEADLLRYEVAHLSSVFRGGNISTTVLCESRKLPLLRALPFKRLNGLRQRHLAQNH